MKSRRHGTRSCYIAGCPEPGCRQAAIDYYAANAQDYRNMVDIVLDVPVAQAREHVLSLRAQGMGKRAVAEAAGLGLNTVDRICRGVQLTARPATVRALLNVTLEPKLVDATGSRRRLQALAAIGWTGAHIAAHSGIGVYVIANITAARGGVNESVTRRTQHAISRAYDGLSMTPGPSDVARRRAAFKGWPPPLAWDDDEIDNPFAVPDLGERSRGVDLDEWLYLVRTGENPHRAATRLGVGMDAIERAAERAGRKDIAAAARSAGRAA